MSGKQQPSPRQPSPQEPSPQKPSPPKTIWAYAYALLPPQPESRMRSVQAVLTRAHLDAQDAARTWEGRFVREQHVTHILVVSDSPAEDGELNARLESGMRKVEAGFSRTAPLIVLDEPAPEPEEARADADPLAPGPGEAGTTSREA
jgi:hypothetical protein